MATKLEYFTDVVLKNYCRTSDELECVYEEMADLQEAFTVLLIENADLRFLAKNAGLELPPSNFPSNNNEKSDNLTD